jgi:rhodanese-related sulfurtransferase
MNPFTATLSFQTDCADVRAALDSGAPGFTLVDCRSPQAYAAGHLPGAVNLPSAAIGPDTVLPAGPFVTYCDGPACNGSTKGAARLHDLGHEVREMIGGWEYWLRDGHPTER